MFQKSLYSRSVLVLIGADRLPKNICSFIPSFVVSMGQFMDHEILIVLQVVIPKLEKLCIYDMENLKDIWPNSEEVNACILKEITVKGCDKLVNSEQSNVFITSSKSS